MEGPPMPTNDLAALSEAATQGANPMLLECVENCVWQIRLVFGEGDDACHAMRQWADAYRAGRLVQIDREGMRERVARSMCAATGKDPDKLNPAPRGSTGMVPLWALWATQANAAIAAILGDAA